MKLPQSSQAANCWLGSTKHVQCTSARHVSCHVPVSMRKANVSGQRTFGGCTHALLLWCMRWHVRALLSQEA